MVIPGLELSKQILFGPEKDATSGSVFPNLSAGLGRDYRTAETRCGSVLSDSSGLLRERGADDAHRAEILFFSPNYCFLCSTT